MALVDSVFLGVYIGVLTGVFAAIIVYILTFLFTYLAGAKLSVNYALMIGLGIAGIAGGPRLLLRNPEILESTTSLVMLLVILITTFYAHQRAQDLGNSLPPKSVALSKLRTRTLASSVVKQVGQFGQVTIRPTGTVGDIEGYPNLSTDLRTTIRNDSWTFPSDLPIPELESRLSEKLAQDYHLEEVRVSIDANGRASINAAPAIGGFSRRVPAGRRVVTVEGLLPAGLATGDIVRLGLAETTVEGSVVSVTDEAVDDEAREAAEDDDDPPVDGPQAATGGVGRAALAVETEAVEPMVSQPVEQLHVRSRGRIKEFEFVSRLRRFDLRFRKVSLSPDSDVADRTIAELIGDESAGVVVLAHKRENRWRFSPAPTVRLRAGDELFVTGPRTGLDAFEAVVA